MSHVDYQEADNEDHGRTSDDGILAEKDVTKISPSPPHRKLRALRLFDTPHTPKSLLRRASTKLRGDCKSGDRPQANVNPFTPEANTPPHPGSKRSRHSDPRR